MRTPLQTALVYGLALGAVLFGVFVVHRTACLSRKTGDLDCYLRAGWAVRAGVNPYDVVCDNNWHYNYPPPYAILMAPLADPPAGEAVRRNPVAPDVGWCVPFVVSAAICYLLNIVAFLLGVHLLASALERSGHWTPDAERWWWLRLTPLVVGLVPLGQTVVRGQVNTLVLLCICGLLARLIERRSFRAGLWLAAAIALKVIPGYLLLLPLWLRDRRCLTGTGVGLVAWLVALPLVTLGPTQTLACYERFAQATLGPALRLGGDATRSTELINVTATDSQSFGAVLHNWLHIDRDTRPAEAAPWTRQVHWLLAGSLTVLTLLAPGGGPLSPARLTLLGGALTTVMILSSPVCHLHYLVLTVPLWMGSLALAWERGGAPLPLSRRLVHLVLLLAPIVPALPGLEITRDLGFVLAVALAGWAYAVAALVRSGPEVAPAARLRSALS